MSRREVQEPEWTAEHMNNKEGDTTFKTCGWCEYRGCGSHRYDCMISGDCSLMKDYGDEREVQWDTECRVVKLGAADIKRIIESKKYEIRSSKESIKRTQKEILVLKTDKRIPRTKKPALPDSRDCDYFKLKDVIWVFNDKDHRWCRGIVVPGYRSGDGFVSYVLDDYPESSKGWGCGMSVPRVFLDWEYKYFKKHQDEFKEYMKICDREYNGERLGITEYIKAMKSEETK